MGVLHLWSISIIIALTPFLTSNRDLLKFQWCWKQHSSFKWLLKYHKPLLGKNLYQILHLDGFLTERFQILIAPPCLN